MARTLRRLTLTLLALLTPLVTVASPAGAQADRLRGKPAPALEPCTVAGLAGDVRCATVSVPENRAKPQGRRLDLRVVVARATDSTAHDPDPFILLAGGPGQAASAMGGFATEAFGGVRRRRDLVFVDARGTGGSAPLHCALVRSPSDAGGEFYPLASVRFCRDSLSGIADLSQYTTRAIADDLEAVREAFGWKQVNMYGTSYGSRLALEYLRRHGAHARAVVLKAVAPPTLVAPMNYARDMERALSLLARDCAADSACRIMAPSPLEDLRAVLARAEAGELRATVARGAATDTVVLSRDVVAAALLGVMQNSNQRARLPALLRSAAAGDDAALTAAVMAYRRGIDRQLFLGMHLSVACSDDGGRLDRRAAARNDAGTYLGDSRVRSLAAACAVWLPDAKRAPAPRPVRSDVPVLLVSGDLDPNTPPRWGEEALHTLSRGRHVVLPTVAHGWSDVSRCGAQFVAQFIERASADSLDLACVGEGKLPPFAPLSLRSGR